MRFLVAHPGPQFSVHDHHVGWVEALRAAGQDVFEYPLNDVLSFYTGVYVEAGKERFRKALTTEQAHGMTADRLYAAVMKTRPHVLISISSFFLPADLFDVVRAAGVRVVQVYTECPYEDDRQVDLAKHADQVIISDPTNLDAFQAVTPTVYLPQAYRPVIHHPGPPSPDLACDFAFVGTGYLSRIDFFTRMDLTGIDVALAGNWQGLPVDSDLRKHVVHDLSQCFDNTDTADLYRSAKAGLNLYRREAQAEHLAVGWAMGPREVEMAACGLFFLRDPRPEGDELLPMLPTFAAPEDAAEQLRWWLEHDSARQAAADQARDAVAERTFDAHAAALLRLLDT